jgi:hypothetical protein
MSEQERIERARDILEKTLRGEITEETHPEIFDEDVFHFSVRIIERHDPTWLLEQIEDRRWPAAVRTLIVAWLGDLYSEAFEILRRELPDLERNRP